MRTQLIEGTDPRPDDKEILSVVRKETKGSNRELNERVLGIRNAAGQLYRRFTTYGPGEFMGVCTALEAYGLKPQSVARGDRCDEVFG